MTFGLSSIFLVLSSFLASTVEMVEALTIVLAVGVTRGWKSTQVGILAALAALAVVVAALGPALTLMPISVLRLVVGALLLIFGLQWLRKAILRASGYKALHDEEAIYRRQLEEARRAGTAAKGGMDWYAFTLSFKGVFLEGLEVAFIVLTFGSSQGSIPLAALGAAAAVVLVTGVGLVVHQPLSRVPENTMKFAVGIMLTTFGIFWGGEGAGVAWPGSDAAILAVLAVNIAFSLLCVSVMKRQRERQLVGHTGIAAGARAR
ncbi:MAG: COG4280 domain-containing protein [Chloroflexota bacterium]